MNEPTPTKSVSDILEQIKESGSKFLMPTIVRNASGKIESVLFPSLDNKPVNVLEQEEIGELKTIKAEYRYPIYTSNILREHHELNIEEPFFSSMMYDIIRSESGPIIGHKARKISRKDSEGNHILDEDGVPVLEELEVKAISVKTACVWFDPRINRFKSYYNPDFISHLTSSEKKSIIKHEMYHILFKHLSQRKGNKQGGSSEAMLRNICQDLAINSFLTEELPDQIVLHKWIIEEQEIIEEQLTETDVKTLLDSDVIVWGVGPKPKTKEELCFLLSLSNIAYMSGCVPLKGLYSHLPPFKTSEWYYSKLSEGGSGKGKRTNLAGSRSHLDESLDVHITQSEIDENDLGEDGERSEHRRICGNAQRKAKSSTWGSVSQDTQESIEKYLSNDVDWKKQLEFFVRKTQQANSYNTFHRPNKRYRNSQTGEPYAPGPRTEVTSKLYVFIDESGSVANAVLEKFFSVLRTLSNHSSFVLIPFDTEVKLDHKVVWEKNTPWREVPRVACGGTSFQCVTDYCNQNSSIIEAAIILTDFQAPVPSTSKVQRLWIGSEEDVHNAKRSNFTFRANERVISINVNEDNN